MWGSLTIKVRKKNVIQTKATLRPYIWLRKENKCARILENQSQKI